MSSVWSALFITACTVIVLARPTATQTPIPSRPLGYVYQTSSSPKIVLEVFYDHLCPDSKANWPMFKQVLDKYNKSDVTGIIHIFPLPYHHNAYFVQQAGVVVRRISPDKFINYTELSFDNFDEFKTRAVNQTEPQVQDAIATFINAKLGIDKQTVLDGFTDIQVAVDARYAWKYAASRTISGTPQFIINGVIDPNASAYTAQQWIQKIDLMLKEPMP